MRDGCFELLTADHTVAWLGVLNGWYPPERRGFALGVYGMGMGGTVIAGLTAPGIADEWGLAAPFWVAAALMLAVGIVFFAMARNAAASRPAGESPRSLDLRRVW